MKTINSKAAVVCSKTIGIQADAKTVWKVLTDIDQWPTWQTDIVKANLKNEFREGAVFVWKTGGVTIKSTIHTVVPERYFGWTGKTFGLFAIHNWTLEEHDGMTLVRVDESMEGFLAVLFKRSFNRNLEKGMQHWLNLLKEQCERL